MAVKNGTEIAAVTQAYSDRHGLGAAIESRRSHFWAGHRDWPVLHLDDVSGIPFLSGVQGVDEYQHRARVRCSDGDLFATVTEPVVGYEEYCQQYLGLGTPEHVFARPTGGSLEVSQGCTEGATYERLLERAGEVGGLLIEPYMGIEATWQLAAQLSADSGSTVQVIAPPPEVTWVANDKALFSELVTDLLGEDALVVTRTATDVPTLANHLREISVGVKRVAIKRPRCASAMGNRLLNSEDLKDLDDASLQKMVAELLASMSWPDGEEVIACVWEETDLSPSTQWWISPTGIAAPRIDGIYEQILSGEEKLFVGSRPSTLHDSINQALVEQSRPVVCALQELGYVGRCSFDHLVVGDPEGEHRLRITECNGRWGGTSTPMHLVDRVVKGQRPAYRAQDFIHEDLIGVPFTEILNRIKDGLYDVRTGEGHFLLYNVGPLQLSGKFDVIGIAQDSAEADRLLTEVLPEMLGV
ncbi:MAG: hypothetical protein VX764_03730 [Planctomycetota bacterium]|nr:hypothetical protein [Planctomycetota bacterium]